MSYHNVTTMVIKNESFLMIHVFASTSPSACYSVIGKAFWQSLLIEMKTTLFGVAKFAECTVTVATQKIDDFTH